MEMEGLGLGSEMGEIQLGLMGDDERREDGDTSARTMCTGAARAGGRDLYLRARSSTTPRTLGESKSASVFSAGYYKDFFNVTTQQILSRLARSVDIRPSARRFYHEEDSKPDLYGPFWICTTLIFLMGEHSAWRYDFEKLTMAAWVFYSSISILPTAVWFGLGFLNHSRGLVEVISIYGYSLFVFVPTCVMCVFPYEWLRWLLVMGSLSVSSAFLLKNLSLLVLIREAKKHDSRKTKGYVFIAAILVAHTVLAFFMKMWFFEYD